MDQETGCTVNHAPPSYEEALKYPSISSLLSSDASPVPVTVYVNNGLTLNETREGTSHLVIASDTRSRVTPVTSERISLESSQRREQEDATTIVSENECDRIWNNNNGRSGTSRHTRSLSLQ